MPLSYEARLGILERIKKGKLGLYEPDKFQLFKKTRIKTVRTEKEFQKAVEKAKKGSIIIWEF